MAPINNSIYETLGERWYEAWDDPVALLRAEGELKHPWILERLRKNFLNYPLEILDVGCGAGFLTNYLSEHGYRVTGLDSSPESLAVAKRHDRTGRVEYVEGDAMKLPFPDQSFDVVASLDFLEHIHTPAAAIAEVSRVLRPGGLFFFHTFNRNLLSWLLVIKCVEWLVKNTPKDMHVIDLFIKPRELRGYCEVVGLVPEEFTGLRPVLSSIPLKSLWSGEVSPRMRFELTDSLLLSYLGYARKTL